MSKKDEALKLALEALDCIYSPLHVREINKVGAAMAALREALAEQPAQQEPVAYSYTSRITGAQGFSHHPMPRFIDSESWDIQPLYTFPPASKPWVGLTDEDKQIAFDDTQEGGGFWEFADAIEAKLKEKNT